MNPIKQLRQDYSHAQLNHSRRQGELDSLQRYSAELTENIQQLETLTEVLDKVTILLNSIGEDKQQEAQEKIEGIITRGLQAIFGETFSFHIKQSLKGKNASVEFFIRTMLGDKPIETPVLESHGGGVAAIVGFLLRVTVLLLSKEQNVARIIVLDETFGMVSDEYLDPLAEFIRELVDKADLQIIMVTHQKEWQEYADATYRFGIRDGATYAKLEN